MDIAATASMVNANFFTLNSVRSSGHFVYNDTRMPGDRVRGADMTDLGT
jgi:hypothetical protein